MKKVARNFMNYNRVDIENGQENYSKTSKTVPNMAYTPKEILMRFAQGKPIPNARPGEYPPEGEFIPDLGRLDLTEQEELINYQMEKVKDLQNKLDEKVKARKAAFNEYKEHMERLKNVAKGGSEANTNMPQ